MTKQIEEKKCREFVELLNRKEKKNRYVYLGSIAELTGKNFPDCKIKDKKADKELEVELTSLGFDWYETEQKNMRVLEKRIGYALKNHALKDFVIQLQPRDIWSHPLTKLKSSKKEDINRELKTFLDETSKKVVRKLDEKEHQSIELNERRHFTEFPTLSNLFQYILIHPNKNQADNRKIDSNHPVVLIGPQGWSGEEVVKIIEERIRNKHKKGTDYSTDILLIHESDFSMDPLKLIKKLKNTIKDSNLNKRFEEIWFLSKFWVRKGQKKEKLFKLY